MRKLKAGPVARSVAKRLAHPKHLIRAVKLQRGRKKNARVYDDAQLALVSQILPGGFLHYGYFDDPAREPDDISVRELMAAQHRYAELLLERVHDRSAPVLDIGCGMGALSKMLLDRGFAPVALTPDRLQASHVRRTFSSVQVIESKFEDLPASNGQAERYGTVITSESLQYLKLDRALPLLARVLKPGGTWVACDYFRTGDACGKSGHVWADFRARIDAAGWDVNHEHDITPNVLPTLRYIHMWATRFGVPLMKFALAKMRAKQPMLHYVLEDVLSMLDGVIEDNLRVVDPEAFAANKRYVLLEMRRRA